MTALALLLAAAGPALAQSTATLKGVDLFRSDQVSIEDVRQKVDRQLESFLRQRNDGRRSALKTSERTKAQIEDAIRRLGKFAFVSLSYNEYVTSADHTAYVTFDVVDQKDAEARMPFRAAPAGSVEDPAGLIAAWHEYAALGQALSSQGLLSTDRPDCPGFFCLYGSATPELAALEKRFAAEAVLRKPALQNVLAQDASGLNRAAALYVLSYLPEGKDVAALCLDSLKDPSPEVRSAALQILADVALYRKDLFFDVRELIAALDFPTVSDRAKALSALVGLADNPSFRPYVISRATPHLLRLLRLEQPSNHDLAFTLLGVLSKESFDRRDYDSWERWVATVSSSAAPSPPPPSSKQ